VSVATALLCNSFKQALRLFALRQLFCPLGQPLNTLHGVFDARKGSAIGQSAYQL